MSALPDLAPFKAPAILDRDAAADLLEGIRLRAQQGRTLDLNASGVEVLTLPCAQIVVAAVRGFEQMSIENPSEAFMAAVADLGLKAEVEGAYVFREAVPAPDAQQAAAPEPDLQDVAWREAEVQEIEAQEAAPPDATDDPVSATDEAAMTKRILTIDDSRTIRDMLRITLAGAGYDVVQAVDGQDGIDAIKRERFDVVITDINMPVKDGYAVIREIRGDPALDAMPVLVLTTEGDADKRQIAREAGATGWMVKPFEPERLIDTVRKVAP